MDTESLVQIRHIVTEAVQGVREEMAVLGTDLRSDITDIKQHMRVLTTDLTDTKQHMGVLASDITDIKCHMSVLTEDLTDTKQHMGVLASDITDTKRYMGVLTEGVRHEIQLVAEAVQLQSERMTDVRRDVERQAQETRALLQLSYEQLQQRVANLEQRVRIIE